MFVRPCAGALVAGALLAAASAPAQQTWKVSEGTLSFQLPRQLFADIHLSITGINQTATPRADHREAVGLAVTRTSTLKFGVQNWTFQGFSQGAAETRGGFTIKGPKGLIKLVNPSIEYRRTGSIDNLFVKAGPGADDLVVFDLTHAKANFNRPDESIIFGFADAQLTDKAARVLGVPEWSGQVLGMVTVASRATFVDGNKDDSEPPSSTEGGGGVNGNVKLETLGSAQVGGYTGTYPNRLVGIGMSTTSCNTAPWVVGQPTSNQDSVDWFYPFPGGTAPMDERHPVIPQNFYRIKTVNGGSRFEQIGVGWVKHGFFATNATACATPSGPNAGGDHLYPGRTDTYGASLNYSWDWLGPRSEINPFTGWWECTGSFFANYQPDCVERNYTAGLSGADHMCAIDENDLAGQPAGTVFIYEANYISHDDVDRYNNAAWRTCTPTRAATSPYAWTFGGAGTQVQGVAIDGWGDPSLKTGSPPVNPRAQPQTEGDIIVGSLVTDLGGGMYHYEYAVYNHTSDRQMRTFSVPVGDEVTITNIEFRDTDKDATNQWTATRANCALTWSTDTFASNPNANSLKWGTTYNFRFDANVAPSLSAGTLTPFKPGALTTLAALIKGPAAPFVNPTTFSYTGGLISGGLEDLFCNEDNKLILRPGPVLVTSQPPATLTVEGTLPIQNPTTFKFRIESSASLTNINQKIEVKNFTTGLFDQLDSRTMTTGDTLLELPIATSGEYVEAGTKKVIARISFKANGATLVYPWQARTDQAVWIAQ